MFFLNVAIVTDKHVFPERGYCCNVGGRHNFLAQKLEAKFVSLLSVHSHAHRFASAS